MREGWKIIPFEHSIQKVKYTTKVPSSDYLPEGEYPIVSQEEGLISGYWNNSADVFHHSKPVVIFGDHTRIIKYVDFDFVLGADGVKILLPVEGLSAKFLSYYLKWYKVPSLGYSRHFKLLKEASVPVPPVQDQEKIVAELDCLASIIANKKKQLAEMDNLAQSIFYDIFGDPLANEKEWNTYTIGSICSDVRYGTSRAACDGGHYKYLRMGNLTYVGEIDITNIKYIDIPDNEIDKCIVRKGDVLFNRTNSLDLVGKTCLFDFDENMVIAGYIIRVRLCPAVNPVYFVSVLNTSQMKKLLKSIAKGAVNQANINAKEFQSIEIPIPPKILQEEFSRKIEKIKKQKELIEKSIAETETLFNSRMDYWFNN